MRQNTNKREKERKGKEKNKGEWKNNESRESTSVIGRVSKVKEGDGNEVKRSKEGRRVQIRKRG